MNCRDCLDLLDGLEPGAAIPDPCRRHAESCPACALALRIEATLRDAPAWAEAPHLSPGTKAGVLSGARVGRLFWRQAAALFEDALVTSLVILFVAAGVVFLAPSLVGSLVPEPARQTMSRFMQPLLGSLGHRPDDPGRALRPHGGGPQRPRPRSHAEVEVGDEVNGKW
jgi:hypothetical protein